VKTLVDASMPAGLFRLNWDFVGTGGRQEAATASYTYRLWINDQLHRESHLGSPRAIWK
jgi:hypothetical protein